MIAVAVDLTALLQLISFVLMNIGVLSSIVTLFLAAFGL
jgi:hypothetical protein